jgi:hypothetical protein
MVGRGSMEVDELLADIAIWWNQIPVQQQAAPFGNSTGTVLLRDSAKVIPYILYKYSYYDSRFYGSPFQEDLALSLQIDC